VSSRGVWAGTLRQPRAARPFFFSYLFSYFFFRWYSHHDPFSLQITAANLKRVLKALNPSSAQGGRWMGRGATVRPPKAAPASPRDGRTGKHAISSCKKQQKRAAAAGYGLFSSPCIITSGSGRFSRSLASKHGVCLVFALRPPFERSRRRPSCGRGGSRVSA
jgi:hypothetical protein